MKVLDKKIFKKVILKNKIDLASGANILSLIKGKICGYTPFIFIFNRLKPLLKQIEEDKIYYLVDFFFQRGIVVPFEGDFEKYFENVLVEIVKKYYPTVNDSKSECKRKIDVLYELLVNNKNIIQFDIQSKIVDLIDSLIAGH